MVASQVTLVTRKWSPPDLQTPEGEDYCTHCHPHISPQTLAESLPCSSLVGGRPGDGFRGLDGNTPAQLAKVKKLLTVKNEVMLIFLTR